MNQGLMELAQMMENWAKINGLSIVLEESRCGINALVGRGDFVSSIRTQGYLPEGGMEKIWSEIYFKAERESMPLVRQEANCG